DGVPAVRPVDIFDELICILDRELGSVGVRTDLNSVHFIDDEVGKYIEARELLAADRIKLRKAVEAKPELIGQIRRKRMEFGYGCDIKALRQGSPEARQNSEVVQSVALVKDEPRANLIFIRMRVVDAGQVGGKVGVIG